MFGALVLRESSSLPYDSASSLGWSMPCRKAEAYFLHYSPGKVGSAIPFFSSEASPVTPTFARYCDVQSQRQRTVKHDFSSLQDARDRVFGEQSDSGQHDCNGPGDSRSRQRTIPARNRSESCRRLAVDIARELALGEKTFRVSFLQQAHVSACDGEVRSARP